MPCSADPIDHPILLGLCESDRARKAQATLDQILGHRERNVLILRMSWGKMPRLPERPRLNLQRIKMLQQPP